MKGGIFRYPLGIKWIFFWAGVIATFAYRVIIVLNFYSPYWVKVFWYIGTAGFILYFGYRFDIQRREKNLIKDYDLVGAVKKSKLKGKQKKVLEYVIKTNLNSKAKWNSLFIFLLSILALVIGILLDVGWIGFG